jgi:hypothetical protein
MYPSPPPGFFIDTQLDRTLAPRVTVQWRDGDFRVIALEDIQKGDVMWEESAVLVFGKDPRCPLNYAGAPGAIAEHTTLHKRLHHLPQLMASLSSMKSVMESHPESFSLQLCFLSHCFSKQTSGMSWSWLHWCPWSDIFKNMYPNSEADARTATTFSAAVLQALPEDLRQRVSIVDLVRLWFIGTRGAVPIAEGASVHAVYHYLSVARRMRCKEVVNCNMVLQHSADTEHTATTTKEGGSGGGGAMDNPIRVRAVASAAIARGMEVCVSMSPVDLGPVPDDVAGDLAPVLGLKAPEVVSNNTAQFNPESLKGLLKSAARGAALSQQGNNKHGTQRS